MPAPSSRKLSTPRKTLALLLSAMVTASLVLGAGPSASALDEYDVLRARTAEFMTGGALSTSSDPDIVGRINEIDSVAEGFWATMDTSPGRTYLWADAATVVNKHSLSYGRLAAMALAYATPGSERYGDPTLLADTVGGLDWVTSHWYNPSVSRDSQSWYFTEVSAPTNLLNAATLLYDDLTPAQLNSYIGAADHFVPTSRGVTGDYVAANRVWKSYVVLLSGMLAKSATKLALARDALSQVLDNVSTLDGFYADGSFIQHAWYPYAGSYGTSLISSLANTIYLLDGSTWAVTDPDLGNVYTWIYTTFEPIIVNGVLMDAFRGREISRYQNQDDDAALTLIAAIATATQTAPSSELPRLSSMLKALIGQVETTRVFPTMPVHTIGFVKEIVSDQDVVARDDLVTHVRYPAQDRLVHHRGGWAYTLGLHSSHTKNYERINGENKKGWYTADGMTYLYTDEDPHAYSDDFWATVNPYRLPGTTTDQTPIVAEPGTGPIVDRCERTKQPTDCGVSVPWSTTMHYTGGASLDQQYGVEAMYLDVERRTLQAKKAWFMFDDEVVSLGAGIASTDGSDINTTIDNRKLSTAGDNAFRINGSPQPTSFGAETTNSSVTSMFLEGTGGYYFPTPTTIKAHRYERSGTWSELNDAYTDGETHTNPFMELWVDHGVNPNAQKYAYVTLPTATATQTTDYAASPDVTILENSVSAMAVKDTTIGVAGYIFWNDTQYTVDGVTASTKAAVMTKTTPETVTVTVTDPTQENTGTITIELPYAAVSIAELPSNVTVTQLSPTIKLTANVANTHGRDTTVVFRANAAGTTTSSPAPTAWPAPPVTPVAAGDFNNANLLGTVPAGWTAVTNGMGTAAVAPFTNSGNWGAQALRLQKTGTGYGLYLRRSFPAVSPAPTDPVITASAYLTPGQDNQNWRMILKSGAFEAVKLTLTNQGKIVANDTITAGTYTANIPYLVEIRINVQTDTFDLFINSVQKLSGAPLKAPVTTIDSQEFSAYGPDSGTLHVDEVLIYRGTHEY